MISRVSSLLNKPLLRRFTRDALLALDPEQAHKATLLALKSGMITSSSAKDPIELNTSIAGVLLSNPVGMAAGFDKNAEVFQALDGLGFGFCEVGTITPNPQNGNAKPRLFRLMPAKAVINRMGFNNQGHNATYERLKIKRPFGAAPVGINIGANKDSEDFVGDYVSGVRKFAKIASYLTINISSPNTPGLRGLQSPQMLERLLGETLDERARQTGNTPVFLKIAPNLTLEAMDDIAATIAKTDLNGLIVSNTTITREGVEGLRHASEEGGLSGQPIFETSTIKLAQMRQRVGPDMAIIGVGGVHSAASALAKFEAGANAIQLYTALVFEGLELLSEIKKGLVAAIKENNCTSIKQLVGTKTNDWAQRNLSS
ncbi:MAG: quinone-dependent dihydroorotate dehydrogenase [Devosiaceae bacterium]|nr:quinone-dependent dihydroorotate dehydrogenase [Devosiaceae bacterium]